MNFETLFLRGLFGACVLICGVTLVSMLDARPATPLPTSHAIAATTTAPVHAAG